MIFSFNFDVTECRGWPKAKFLINKNLLKDHIFSHTQEKIDLELDLGQGQHLLEIVKYGKTDDNCIVESDRIVQDQTLQLTHVLVDEVKLPIDLLRRGTWIWEQRQPGSLYWGPNGTWQWYFEMPFWIWATKIMRNIGSAHVDLLDPLHDSNANLLHSTLLSFNALEDFINERKNKKNCSSS